ncbi:MAG: sulfotransferase [Gammaproteobacteria bacterium]|nr:sulfotransferase [Gammaproteobacteria bacterium]MDP7419418.1 sulfotransferase [Gammaproteobacteria bacterium]
MARKAVGTRDWATVGACADEILRQDRQSPEGHFLAGLVAKAAGRPADAVRAFSIAIKLDGDRYDAAMELAAQYVALLRHDDALDLLQRYELQLHSSPLYLDLAAQTYSRLGLYARAWPLYRKANQLQPGIDRLQANLAACAVTLGRIEEAGAIYTNLLEKNPHHQKNHYELSRLAKAKDSQHVEQMQEILDTTRLPAQKNIFLYYALGKELEDLGQWRQAFHYYKLAGDAVTAVANYDVNTDLDLIDRIIKVCSADWLASGIDTGQSGEPQGTPIFIVGLPRTGTTLTERIVSSHSQVESADESFFMQIAIQRVSGLAARQGMSPAVIEAAAKHDIGPVAQVYLQAVHYRLGGKPMFIDKLPENVLLLGFIAKAFPHARLILLNRNPMDACFALYKQSFFKFAYTLENLGKYYLAYDRLRRHWRAVLSDRLIEVDYESLVADQQGQTKMLLDKLGLEFEQACLDFDQNQASSATASAVQVREKMHNRSVGKWKHFEQQLLPLKHQLESAGILIE